MGCSVRRVLLLLALAWWAQGCSRAQLDDLAPGAATSGRLGTGAGSGAGPRTGPDTTPDTPAPRQVAAPAEAPVYRECPISCAFKDEAGFEYVFEVATEFDGFPWVYCGDADSVSSTGFGDCQSILDSSCDAEIVTATEERKTLRWLSFDILGDGILVHVEDRNDSGALVGGGTRFIEYDQACELSDGFERLTRDLPPFDG